MHRNMKNIWRCLSKYFLENEEHVCIIVIYIVEEMNWIAQTHISEFKLYVNDTKQQNSGYTREYRGWQRWCLMC